MTTTTSMDYSHLQPPADPQERAAWFADQQERIAKQTARVMVDLVTTATEMFINSLTAAGDMSAFDYIIQGWNEYQTGVLVEELQGMYLAGGVATYISAPTTGMIATNVGETWVNIVNQSAVDYALEASNRMADVGQTAWNTIKNKVSQAVEQGTSVENLKKMLEKNKSFSEFRADTIARTEISNAYLNGSWNGMAALGEFGPTHKIWIATADARSRETHIEVAGQVLPINEPYSVGGEPMMYPHSPGASAKNVVNCRCDIGYLYPGDINPYTGETIPMPTAMAQPVQPPAARTTIDVQPIRSRADMDAFAQRQIRNGLTEGNFPDQADSVAQYQGNGYAQINNMLRGTLSPSDGLRRYLQNQIDDIDHVMSRASAIEEPMVTYRGVRAGYAQQLRSLNVGDEFVDAGFVSTSMREDIATDFLESWNKDGLLIEIVNPVGTKGFMPAAFSNFRFSVTSDEMEWLLPRGTRFRVIDVKAASIRVEVV